MIVSSHLNLILTPDNPSNTTITDAETNKVVYQVTTTFEPTPVTTLANAAGITIASWEWKDVRSDILTLGKNKPVPSSAWLKKSIVPFKDTVTFAGPGDKTYKWKGNSPGLSLELYAPDDKSSAIARFKKSHRIRNPSSDPPSYTNVPAQLTIAGHVASESNSGSDVGTLQDLIVVSFLMLEKSRRAREASTGNKADVLGQPLKPFGKGDVLTNGGI